MEQQNNEQSHNQQLGDKEQDLKEQLVSLQAEYQAQEEFLQTLLKSDPDIKDLIRAKDAHQELSDQIEELKKKIKQ